MSRQYQFNKLSRNELVSLDLSLSHHIADYIDLAMCYLRETRYSGIVNDRDSDYQFAIKIIETVNELKSIKKQIPEIEYSEKDFIEAKFIPLGILEDLFGIELVS